MEQIIKKTETLHFILTDVSKSEDQVYIHEQIKAFNNIVSEHHRMVRKIGTKSLNIFISDHQGEIWGGLVADTYWGWLEIDDFWLDESLRRQGYGREMLAYIEAEAIKEGCTQAFLQTFSFQARGFYEKQGYYVVGQMDDYPPGHALYWMRKDFGTT